MRQTILAHWSAEQPQSSKIPCSKQFLLKSWILQVLCLTCQEELLRCCIRFDYSTAICELHNLRWFSVSTNICFSYENIIFRYIRRNQLDAGFPLFETESLKWPGFVEFDDVNGKVLTYSAQDGYALEQLHKMVISFHLTEVVQTFALVFAVSIRSSIWRITLFYIQYLTPMCRRLK